MIETIAAKDGADVPPSSRTVAIFDVLGVKDEILSGRAAELISRYQSAVFRVDQLRHFEHPAGQFPRLFPIGMLGRHLPSIHIFSDTLILIAPDETAEATLAALLQSWRLMQTFMTARMPLRGGIVHGEMFIDASDRLHVGLALTKAHLLEAAQAWAGCAIDASVTERIPDDLWEAGTLFDVIFPWFDVPLKGATGSSERRRVINWRCNLVFDRGFLTDFCEAYRVLQFDELHPYLKRALEFGKAHKQYLEPADQIPVECRVFWVGKSEPPFKNGDDY